MTFRTGLRRIATTAAAAALLLSAGSAFAQEISESHLKAARAAIDAINATDDYDDILPAIARTIRADLIQSNPDLQALISQTVDEETVAMVSRRVDLEKEIATIYARSLTEEELTTIATFYQSAAGQKLLTVGPVASRETNKAVDIWQRGLARDLTQAVGAKLEKVVGAMAPSQTAPVTPGMAPTAPAGGTAAPATSQ